MGFRSSLVKRRPDCSLTVLVWVDSVVVIGFIQRRCCLCTTMASTRLRVSFCGGLCQIGSFSIWFSLYFFRLCFWHLFLFCFIELKMGGDFVPALWFGLKTLNLVFWIEDLGSLVLVLFFWMHILIQHDLFYLDVAQKGRCVDALYWR